MEEWSPEGKNIESSGRWKNGSGDWVNGPTQEGKKSNPEGTGKTKVGQRRLTGLCVSSSPLCPVSGEHARHNWNKKERGK